MTWLLALLACTRDDGPAPPDSEPFQPECQPVEAPDGAAWQPAGVIPARGFNSLEQAAGQLVLGSYNAGSWSLLAEGWGPMSVRVTHTMAQLAPAPSSPGRLYRSAGGVVERSEDGGASWSSTSLGSLEEPQLLVTGLAVAGWDAERVWAVGQDGSTAISVDGGQSAAEGEPVELPPPGAWHEMEPMTLRGPEGEQGRVLLAYAGGLWSADVELSGWTLLREDLASGHALARKGSRAWVGTSSGVAWSEDEGESWEELTLGHAGQALAGTEDWLAVAEGGRLSVLEEGAVTERELPDQALLLAVRGEELWLAGEEGVWLSEDRGRSWALEDQGLEDPGMSVVVADPWCPEQVWAGSRCSGGLFRSLDGGASWQRAEHPFHYVMNLVVDPNVPSRRWAVSDDALFLSLDEGVTWTERWTAHHFHGFALHPSDPDLLLLGSVGSGEYADESGRVYRSEDLGLSWEAAQGIPDNEASAHSLLWLDEERVLAAFYKGGDMSHLGPEEGIGLYLSEDRGHSFSEVQGPSANIAWLAHGAERIWAAHDQGLSWSGDGETWSSALDEPCLSVAFHEDLGLALTQAGAVLRSEDGGRSWSDWSEQLPEPLPTDLGQVALSADGQQAWVSLFGQGVWTRGAR